MIVVLSLVCLLSGCSPTTVGGNDGGGASETVATVAQWENTFKVVVSGDAPFTVTAEVCSDSFKLTDTSYFHMKKILTNETPEWIVPYFPDPSATIIVRNGNENTAAYLTYVKTISLYKPPVSDTLLVTGAVRGIIRQSDGSGAYVPAPGMYVGITGTMYSTVTNENGEYRLQNLPQGEVNLYTINDRKNSNKLPKSGPVVISGDTTVIWDIILE